MTFSGRPIFAKRPILGRSRNNSANYGRDVYKDPKKGLLRSKRTGRYLTTAQANKKYRKVSPSRPPSTRSRLLGTRNYPKRPFVKPVLDRFVQKGKILKAFRGILGGR